MTNEILLDIPEFHEACRLLSKRQFGESMSCAEKVLLLANKEGSIERAIKALHFIVEINNTQGRYESEKELFYMSLKHLEEILTPSISIYPNEYLWETRLKKVETLLLLEKYEEAKKLLLQCEAEEALLQTSTERRIHLLLSFSELYYLQNEYDRATHYTRLSFDLLDYKESKEGRLLLKVYAQAIRVCLRRHDHRRIQEYGIRTVELSEKYNDEERKFIGLNAIAVHHGSKYDFKMAMLYFRNALNTSLEINYRYGTAYCLVNIGTIYANLYNYSDALDYYTTVLGEYGDVLDNNTGLIILNNIGNIYFVVGRLDEALEYFERSLNLAESINYNEMRAHTLAQISRALAAKGVYNKALDYAFQSERIIMETGDREGKQINLITIGDIYYKLKNYEQALNYVGRGLVCSKEVRDEVSEIRGYRLMSNIFKEKRDFEKALEYQLRYSEAQEKYAMAQRNLQIIDVEIRYDIQQKEKEIALLKKYKNQLSAQHEKIKEQNKQLISANDDLMQFAYAVSHDLKEPLRMVGSYSQLIQRRYEHQLDSSSDKFFYFVNEGVSRMNQLLDDLLKYAIIGKEDDQNWERVNLAEILRITKFSLKLVIEESGASITSNTLPVIFTNRAYMSQLFQNFISNAIKFRGANRETIVKVRYEKRIDKHHITFEDNGIGIPQEAIRRIFLIFQRLHKRGGYEGTGIGLSICTKIMDRLGGRILVESEEGVGSKFTIVLPERLPGFLEENNGTPSFLDEGF